MPIAACSRAITSVFVMSPRVRSMTRAQRVGRAPQPTGERIGIVDGDEQPVDVVHDPEQPLGFVVVGLAQGVECLATQLARGFGHPVEVGLHLDAELVGRRHRLIADEREREIRLREFLLGVVQEARVPDVGLPDQRGFGFAEVRRRFRDQLAGLGELAPLDGADRRRTRSDGLARRARV